MLVCGETSGCGVLLEAVVPNFVNHIMKPSKPCLVGSFLGRACADGVEAARACFCLNSLPFGVDFVCCPPLSGTHTITP